MKSIKANNRRLSTLNYDAVQLPMIRKDRADDLPEDTNHSVRSLQSVLQLKPNETKHWPQEDHPIITERSNRIADKYMGYANKLEKYQKGEGYQFHDTTKTYLEGQLMFRLNKKQSVGKPNVLSYNQYKKSDPFVEQSTEDTAEVDPSNMYSDAYLQRRKEFDKYNDNFYDKLKVNSGEQSKPQKVLRTQFKEYKPANKSVNSSEVE